LGGSWSIGSVPIDSFRLARCSADADIELNPGPQFQDKGKGRVHGPFSVLEGDDPNAVDDITAQWLFADTPGSMSEHLNSHVVGTAFKGAVVSKVASYTMDDAWREFAKMRESHERSTTSVRPIGSILQLKSQLTKLRLTKKNVATPPGMGYFCMKALMVDYVPLGSFASEGSAVTIRLVDTGLSGKVQSESTASRTLPSRHLLGFSHYAPVERLHDLQIEVSVAKTGTARKDIAWGTVDIALTIEWGTHPTVSGTTVAQVVYDLPSSILRVESVDPTQFNAVLRQQDLEALRRLGPDLVGFDALNIEGGSIKSKYQNVSQQPLARDAPISTVLSVDPFNLRGLQTPPSPTSSTLSASESLSGVETPSVVVPRASVVPTPEMLERAAEMMRRQGFTVSRAIQDPSVGSSVDMTELGADVPKLPTSYAPSKPTEVWPSAPLQVDRPSLTTSRVGSPRGFFRRVLPSRGSLGSPVPRSPLSASTVGTLEDSIASGVGLSFPSLNPALRDFGTPAPTSLASMLSGLEISALDNSVTAVSALTIRQRQVIAHSGSSEVHLRLSDEPGGKATVAWQPFPGSFPIALRDLLGPEFRDIFFD
jgi:hypothetical protein